MTQIQYMFKDAASFNQDISNWDISNINNMIGIFDNTSLSTNNQCAIHTTFSASPYWEYDWSGNCDDDNDGIINSDEIAGCQGFDTACNYNSSATDSDGSCVFTDGVCESCSGATDGTGTVVDNDSDDDGVCEDADEIAGCQILQLVTIIQVRLIQMEVAYLQMGFVRVVRVLQMVLERL